MVVRQAFQAQLNELEQGIVALAVQVKDVIARAVAALAAMDADAGREIVAGDRAIDDREAYLERECLRLIALQQPVAGDLRAIGAALRILIDLERIADHASDIARTAVRLEGEALLGPLVEVPRMAELAQDMVARAVDAYVRRDEVAARALVAVDDEVDHLFSQVFGDLIVLMGQRPEAVRQGTHLLFVASHLERIADHATNLAEAVIYAVTGQRPELND
ncbi:MAG TPA: phosphate signaling complex protein PhoU [Bacillota bacterium]|nr:phosphate signaling complex protein PhoU [Bacillota bacterium]